MTGTDDLVSKIRLAFDEGDEDGYSLLVERADAALDSLVAVVKAAKFIDEVIGAKALGENFDWPALIKGRDMLHDALRKALSV